MQESRIKTILLQIIGENLVDLQEMFPSGTLLAGRQEDRHAKTTHCVQDTIETALRQHRLW